jgi:hypothetical protein
VKDAPVGSTTVSLVLGSGGARGVAHIGVIQWLTEKRLRHSPARRWARTSGLSPFRLPEDRLRNTVFLRVAAGLEDSAAAAAYR